MDKKENQRVRLTKQLLKNSLLELSKTKSLNKISVSELCKEAGINRSTFYVHYGSQYDVLSNIEDDLIAVLINSLRQTNTPLSIDEQIEVLHDCLKEHAAVSKFIFSYNDSNSTFARKLFCVLFDELPTKALLNYEDEEQRLLTTFFINGIYYVIRQWVTEDFNMSAREIGKLGEKIAVAIFGKISLEPYNPRSLN